MTPSGSTRVAAVIGSPVRHSLSPAIHNAAFREHGDDWTYVAYEVEPRNAAAAIDAMRILGLAGLSVTMPHKELVMPALDDIDEHASVIRAVNTVVRDANGRLVGHNTDGRGGVDALAQAGADLSSVAVVGAGATARALIAALAERGSNVCVANRSPERLRNAVAVGNQVRHGSTVAVVAAGLAEHPTIINTTPLGMNGIAPDELPLEVGALGTGHCVLDVVYHPLETAFIRAARSRGCQIVDGLDMLCAQAARQQELWLGRRPSTELMRRAALGELTTP